MHHGRIEGYSASPGVRLSNRRSQQEGGRKEPGFHGTTNGPPFQAQTLDSVLQASRLFIPHSGSLEAFQVPIIELLLRGIVILSRQTAQNGFGWVCVPITSKRRFKGTLWTRKRYSMKPPGCPNGKPGVSMLINTFSKFRNKKRGAVAYATTPQNERANQGRNQPSISWKFTLNGANFPPFGLRHIEISTWSSPRSTVMTWPLCFVSIFAPWASSFIKCSSMPRSADF